MGLVILTVFLTVGSGEVKNVVTGKGFQIHPVLAGFVLGLFLFVFQALDTNVGNKLCYLVMIAALIINGGVAINALNNKSTTTK